MINRYLCTKTKFNFGLVFICIYILLLIFNDNYLYFLLIPIPTFFWIKYSINENKKISKFLIHLFFILIPIILNIWIKDFNSFKWLGKSIDSLINFSLRNELLKFIDNKYDKFTAGFIKFFIFNIKNKYVEDFYKNLINLSIIHLIVISGFHISLINKWINKILCKFEKLTFYTTLAIDVLYTYLINFNIATCRVIFSLIIEKIFKKLNIMNNIYDKTAASGILSFFIFPKIALNIGFCLSYMCTFGVIYANSFNINSVILKKIFTNFICVLISILFISKINGELSLFAIINSLIFSFIIPYFFAIFILSFWMWFIYPFQEYMCYLLSTSINTFSLFNNSIMLHEWKIFMSIIYYYFLFFTIWFFKIIETHTNSKLWL